MLVGNNLKSFLFGGTKDRELWETKDAWNRTERARRSSPLAKQSLFDLSLDVLKDVIKERDRDPGDPVWNAVGSAVEELFRAEDIEELEVDWTVIETDAATAVRFREMLTRRRRWCTDFPRVHASFKRILVSNIVKYFQLLPESCFGDWETEAGDRFEVPLIDLLDDPAAAVDHLFMLPYDDDSFRYDIFNKLRELCVSNMLIASGFLPTTNPREVESKLLRPHMQKKKTGAELANLYLDGSPLKSLLEIPISFHIPESLRFEHCHVVGGTGHGKTQLLQKMIHADLVASQQDFRSVIVIDSQGDLIQKLSRLALFAPEAPDTLADRLVVIDPADVEYPAALNLFDAHVERVRNYSPADRERVLNGVIELYEMFFGTFLGAELTQKQGVIFRYLAQLMLAIPGATIHTLMRVMEDGKAYKEYMDQLEGSARYFFETEFFHPSFTATKKQILRRLWGVLSMPAFERMFSQENNKIDLYEAMNEGKIVLVSTAKDLLKREGSQLLGRFFIAMVMQAALERSTLPEYRRNAAFVYIDEAQEYFDDSIETILNQARKYHVGLTLAHQTLDQLSPRLRSAILANTSMKCAGGVSAKDARALAEELRTTPEFIEGMRRRGERSEFAVRVKHFTGQAIRLSVPLGFLEKQPTLDEEDYDALLAANRDRYCGTLADMPRHSPPPPPPRHAESPGQPETRQTRGPSQPPASPSQGASKQPPRTPASSAGEQAPPAEARPSEPSGETKPPIPTSYVGPMEAPDSSPLGQREFRPEREPIEDHAYGKGGPKHRYLQALVKELAEQHGLKATLEAPLADGKGQIDVLIEHNGVLAAIEISVTTPVEYEKENVRKCLATDCPRIAVVLAKSKLAQKSYRAALSENLAEAERERVSFLTPEEVPDFIASLAPPPDSTEQIVKGYRVKRSFVATSAEESKSRREVVARLIARSLAARKE